MVIRGARAGGPVPKRRKKKSTDDAPGQTPTRRKGAPREAVRRTGATEVALAGLAHDIRTPLTGMLALADLLLASDLPERERRLGRGDEGCGRASGAAHHPRGRCRARPAAAG